MHEEEFDPFGTQSRGERCPYCGEPIELVLDPSEPVQEYVEDCTVCCRPMVVSTWQGADGLDVRVRREDDT